jgi:hypothetical protein
VVDRHLGLGATLCDDRARRLGHLDGAPVLGALLEPDPVEHRGDARGAQALLEVPQREVVGEAAGRTGPQLLLEAVAVGVDEPGQAERTVP